MKRRTLLLVLVPILLVVAGAFVMGMRFSATLPTYAEIDALDNIESSRMLRKRIKALEPLVTLCLTVGTTGLVLAAGVVLYHISLGERVVLWRERVFREVEVERGELATCAAAAGAAAVLCCVLLVAANSANIAPVGDEISFLETAIKSKEEYGVAGFAGALYSGQWREHNRHPLYIWAIMPTAERSVDFFVRARLLSTLVAGASIAVVFFVAWRLFGLAPAVMAGLLYGVNRQFVVLSSAIMCEGLLVSFVTLSFFFTVRGFERGRLMWLGGAFAGLAYMTQLNGLFVVVAFFMAAFVVWRWRMFRRREVYAYLAAFVVVASPLLVRNTIRYGNPVSNYNMSLLWLDGRAQTDSVRFSEGRTGAVAYLGEKGAVKVAIRMAEGSEVFLTTAAVTTNPLMRVVYHFSRRHSYPVGRWVGLAILAVASAFVIFDTRKHRRMFVMLLALVVFVPMSWYARVTMSTRFVVPFLPMILAYFAVGVTRCLGGWRFRSVVIVLGVALALWSGVGRLRGLRRPAAAPPEDAMVLADWLEEHLEPGQLYLLGPDETLRFGWHYKRVGASANVPSTRDIPTLVAASRKRNATYVVLSRKLLEQRHLQFAGYAGFNGRDFALHKPIEGWRKVFEDPVGVVDYIVFEVTGGNETKAPPSERSHE